MRSPVICLFGPTASGKTPLASELVSRLPCDIISVDSAMIYRGMDIGTAKPTAAELAIAPHRLIDILDPAERYSAGQFIRDAMREIESITAAGRIPLLVGGTMLYFKALQAGLANLPKADPVLRETLTDRVAAEGLAVLHEELQQCDPKAAAKIQPQDSQRILRALEVFLTSGKPISQWQKENRLPLADYAIHNFALMGEDRAWLHGRIAQRFDQMLNEGFLDEVATLYKRPDLSSDLPSIRSVGYRQVWQYLAGEINRDTMREQAVAATRQLAKRQITWIRSWDEKYVLPFDNKNNLTQFHTEVDKIMNNKS